MFVKDNYAERAIVRRSQVVNFISYVTFLGTLISITPDLYYGLWLSASVSAMNAFFFLFIVWANKKFGVGFAANLLLISVSISIFIISNFVGKAANLHLFYIFIILCVPFVVDIERKELIILHMLHPFIGLVVLELTSYHLIPSIYNLTAEEIDIFGSTNLILLFLILPFLVYSIIRFQNESEKELRSSEEKLTQQNYELQKMNTELDQFAYSVSHDLRAPIASVLGLVNLSKLDNDLNQLKDYNLLKEESLLKLDGFIEDILHHSRNSRIEIVDEEINFENLITDLIGDHQYMQEGIQISVQVKQHDKFYSDKYRLSIILKNLISNAIRYYDPLKEHSKIDIEVIITKEYCIIIIRDNGLGIEDVHKDKIFEMFYRASTVSKGSGLGLYLVKECLHKIEGTISLDSQIGIYSEFKVRLRNKISKHS